MTDEKLVQNVKNNNCNESLKTLIFKHAALCFNVYKRYAKALESNGLTFDDIKLEKDLIIYNSCLSFKREKKVKFSTWLGNYARYYCLNMINKNRNYVCVEEDELIYHIDKSSSQDFFNRSENPDEFRAFILNILEQAKDKRIIKIFKRRYFSEKKERTWSNISRDMNLSIQTAINLHTKGLGILRTKMNSENLLDLI